MKAFWHKTKNFGDAMAPIILQHILGVGEKIEWADKETNKKIVSTGSVIYGVREGDVVWGTGMISDTIFVMPNDVKILALRGPMTMARLRNAKATYVFGDPGMLMPLIYQPKTEKKYEIGYVPHYMDKANHYFKGKHTIDPLRPPHEVIDRITECKAIVSSSLHGIIIAEAYGIPAYWIVVSDKIIGGQFKFNDYFLGTGRQPQNPNTSSIGDMVALPAIKNLGQRQRELIDVLKKHYGK